MKRLLIMGNSHTAAIRAGWESIQEKPSSIEVDFLAAKPTILQHFSFDGSGRFGLIDRDDIPAGRLVASEAFSGSLVRTISDYTHVIVVGQNFANIPVLNLIAEHNVDGIREMPSRSQRLSRAAFEEFSVALSMEQFPGYLVDGFRQLKIGLSRKPRRNDDLSSVDEKAESYVWRLAADPAGVNEALKLHEAGLARRCAERKVRLFSQPEETWGEFGLTQQKFGRGIGSILMRDRTIPDDTVHMNAEFGALCMGRYLDWVLEDG